MQDLKELFIININTRLFVPIIKVDKKYYHVEYKSKLFGQLHFAVTKSSYMKAIKMTIKNEIYNELKKRGVY